MHDIQDALFVIKVTFNLEDPSFQIITAKKRHPNFSVIPGYCITVNFTEELSRYPSSHTCSSQVSLKKKYVK